MSSRGHSCAKGLDLASIQILTTIFSLVLLQLGLTNGLANSLCLGRSSLCLLRRADTTLIFILLGITAGDSNSSLGRLALASTAGSLGRSARAVAAVCVILGLVEVLDNDFGPSLTVKGID